MGRERVPLGMNVPIPSSNGVFPASGEISSEMMEEAPEIEMQSHVTNYKSFVDAPEDAEIEVHRSCHHDGLGGSAVPL